MSDNFTMKRCCHCNTMAEYVVPSDYRKAVIKDLDGRPFENEEFSLKNTIMRCPKCGYVSYDVSYNVLKDPSIVASDEYENILNCNTFTKEINNFIALGYIYEKQGEFYQASHAYLSAAWLCQDNGKDNESKSILEKSALCMLRHINSEVFKDNIDLFLLQCAVDVLRQIEKFDNAKKLADFSLTKCDSVEYKNIFLLEKSLCENYISTPHAYKPETKKNILSIDSLVKAFEQSKNYSKEEKLDLFEQCKNYLATLLYEKLDNGVEIVFNRENNTQLNFTEYVNILKGETFTSISAKTEDVVNKNIEKEDKTGEEVILNKKPEFVIPKIITKMEDIAEKEDVKNNEGDTQPKIEIITKASQLNFSEDIVEENEDVKATINNTIQQEIAKVQQIEENSQSKNDSNDYDTIEESAEETIDIIKVPYCQEIEEDNIQHIEEVLPETLEDVEVVVDMPEEEKEYILDDVEEVIEKVEERDEIVEKIEENNEEDDFFKEFENFDLTQTVDLNYTFDNEQNEDNREEIEFIEEKNTVEEHIEINKCVEESVEQEEDNQTNIATKEIVEEECQEKTEDVVSNEIINATQELSQEEQVKEDDEIESLIELSINGRGQTAFAGFEDMPEPIEEEEEIEEREVNNQPLEEKEEVDDIDEEQYLKTIMTLASLDGRISISEVQTLFEFGYVKARELLEKLTQLGKLEYDKNNVESYKVVK